MDNCQDVVSNIIDTGSLYIISDPLFFDDTSKIKIGPLMNESLFSPNIHRLNKEKLKTACQIIGCKPTSAITISEKILEHFITIKNGMKALSNHAESSSSSSNTTDELFIYKDLFMEVLKKNILEYSKTKPEHLADFEIAIDIIEQNKSIIIFLGGTSGSGKSTVASLLASRFGISTVLSTDTIRHIMRNFMSNEECPVLFASTYEAGKKIRWKEDEDLSEKKKVLAGYQEQSLLVQQRLLGIIETYHSRGESMVIEGVHLTPDFMLSAMKKFTNSIPFIICISNESKHRERFAVRSKYMTLDKRYNKYVENFLNIRYIHKYNVKKADEFLIPKVDNSNVDKSLGIIHRTIMRCLRKVIFEKKVLYNESANNALSIYEEFNRVTKNIWSSQAVKEYINAKAVKANKKEIFKRFFKGNENPTLKANSSIQKDPGYKASQEFKECKEYKESIEKEYSSGFELTKERSINDQASIRGVSKPIKNNSVFKEDKILPYESSLYHNKQLIMNPTNLNNSNLSSGFLSPEGSIQRPLINNVIGKENHDDGDESSTNQDKKEISPLNPIRKSSNQIYPLPSSDVGLLLIGDNTNANEEEKNQSFYHMSSNMDELSCREPTLINDEISNESNIMNTNPGNQKISSPRVLENGITKTIIKFDELEDFINTKSVISLKKNISFAILKKVKKLISTFNGRSTNTDIIRLVQTNERYIIYKFPKKDYSSENIKQMNETILKPHEIPLKHFRKFKRKNVEDLTSMHSTDKYNTTGNEAESGSSDGDNENSEDDNISLSSLNSQERSSAMSLPTSIEANYNVKTLKGSMISEKYEISDDIDSGAKMEGDDDTQEDHNDLEILTGNSISEQDEEEDSDYEEVKINVNINANTRDEENN